MKVRMRCDHRELRCGEIYDLPDVRALALVEHDLASKQEDESKPETATREQPSTATKAPQRRRRKKREAD